MLIWRIFSDDILNMGRKTWAELYFTDDKGAICAVLFHGYSIGNLYRFIRSLFYDDLTLANVVVKVQAEKKETTKDGKKATYYLMLRTDCVHASRRHFSDFGKGHFQTVSRVVFYRINSFILC